MGYGLRHGVYDFKREIVSAGGSYPTDGLLARWAFDDDDLNDSYGSYNLSQAGSGSTSYGTGGKPNDYLKGAGYAYYNSSSDLYSIFQAKNTWSLSLWFRYNSSGGDTMMQSIGTATWNAYKHGIYFLKSSTNVTVFRKGVGTDNNVFSLPSGIFTDNSFHHYVFWYDGTQVGLSVDNSASSPSASSESVSNTDNKFILNSSYTGVWSDKETWYDSVYVYNRALTSAEIATLYNSGAGI